MAGLNSSGSFAKRAKSESSLRAHIFQQENENLKAALVMQASK